MEKSEITVTQTKEKTLIRFKENWKISNRAVNIIGLIGIIILILVATYGFSQGDRFINSREVNFLVNYVNNQPQYEPRAVYEISTFGALSFMILFVTVVVWVFLKFIWNKTEYFLERSEDGTYVINWPAGALHLSVTETVREPLREIVATRGFTIGEMYSVTFVFPSKSVTLGFGSVFPLIRSKRLPRARYMFPKRDVEKMARALNVPLLVE